MFWLVAINTETLLLEMWYLCVSYGRVFPFPHHLS